MAPKVMPSSGYVRHAEYSGVTREQLTDVKDCLFACDETGRIFH